MCEVAREVPMRRACVYDPCQKCTGKGAFLRVTVRAIPYVVWESLYPSVEKARSPNTLLSSHWHAMGRTVQTCGFGGVLMGDPYDRSVLAGDPDVLKGTRMWLSHYLCSLFLWIDPESQYRYRVPSPSRYRYLLDVLSFIWLRLSTMREILSWMISEYHHSRNSHVEGILNRILRDGGSQYQLTLLCSLIL